MQIVTLKEAKQAMKNGHYLEAAAIYGVLSGEESGDRMAALLCEQAAALRHAGSLYYVKSMEVLFHALDVVESVTVGAQCFRAMARLYVEEAVYDEAIILLEHARELFDQEGDMAEVAITTSHLGRVMLLNNKPATAQSLLMNAQALMEEYGDEEQQLDNLLWLQRVIPLRYQPELIERIAYLALKYKQPGKALKGISNALNPKVAVMPAWS